MPEDVRRQATFQMSTAWSAGRLLAPVVRRLLVLG
jgi:hypothetical protein